ncbi:MAG TPA: RNA-directed DNA polymerase [Thermoanaerobaculia bacterium]
MERYFRAAIDNITRLGDTDVLPFPVESQIFYDKKEETVQLLKDIHLDLKAALQATPPVNESMLAAIGYTGFRWATQIDPIWNAYFLSLVISIGEEIERARIPVERGVVFSYRFKLDNESASIFDREIGWGQFQQQSVSLAQQFRTVLACDISDFYPRIYHHRLENALQKAAPGSDANWRIMLLLSHFSKNVSYGLPVGGPAARLLSELLLNRVDRLLITSGTAFCRFADDYHIFAQSPEEAYGKLIFLSEKLLENEGLLLQKSKTRIVSSEEFLATTEFSDHELVDTEEEAESRQFLKLRLHYDPYSQTAVEDYEELRAELARFDIVKMLAREMRKSRIQQTLTRKLIGALKFLEPTVRNGAIATLLENLNVLYPVFPSIALLLKSSLVELDESVRDLVFRTLRKLLRERSYIVMVPANLAFTVRLLAYDLSEESDAILVSVYEATQSIAIRRDVILAMARKNADYWISDRRKYFSTLSEWEKRAILISSYILDDEGSHWRRNVALGLTPLEQLTVKWASERKSSGTWSIPI